MINNSDKQSFSILLLLVLTFGIMLLLANMLLLAKTEQALRITLQETALTATESLQRSLTEGYTLGIYPETLVTEERLNTITTNSDRIQAVGWFNTQGQLVISSKAFTQPMHLTQNQLSRLLNGDNRIEMNQNKNHPTLAITLKNTFAQPIGFLAIRYSMREVAQFRSQLIDESIQLAPWLMGTGTLAFLVVFLVRRLSRRTISNYWALTGLSTLGMIVLAVLMFKQTEPLIQPFLSERLNSIANAETQLWAKAKQLGFTLDDFKPLNNYLNGLVNNHREIGDAKLVQNKTAKPAIGIDETRAIALHANPYFLRNIQLELALDYFTLALILFFFWSQFKKEPIKNLSAERSQQVTRLKPLLFLFFLSEELIRPILPTYATSKTVFEASWLNANWVPSLSISVFMVVVALSQLFLSRITQFEQAKRYWLWGAMLVAAGQTLLLLTPWAELLLFARLLAGLGYACCFVSSQSMLLMVYGDRQKVLAFANLVVCIMAATVVGPAFGGLMTDYFGQQATILLAISCPVIAVVFAMSQQKTQNITQQTSAANPQQKSKPLKGLTQPALLGLSLLAAVPAKMMLTGLLFFLLPLMTVNDGLTAADVGRLILIYGFLMLFGVPWFARLSHQLGPQHSLHFVTFGLLVSSLCAVLPTLTGLGIIGPVDPFLMAAPVALALGLGQSISISSQAALVQTLQSHYAPNAPAFAWLGTYRFIERLGNAMGPPVAAILLMHYGTAHTLIAFGGMAAVCACLAFAWLNHHTTPTIEHTAYET